MSLAIVPFDDTKLAKYSSGDVNVCCCCYKQELEEKELELEFYKEQEQVHQEEIQAYKRVEASACHVTCIHHTDNYLNSSNICD